MLQLILLLSVAGTCCATAANNVVEPADSRIHYEGRWDKSNPARPWCAWQGSSLSAQFRGSGIQAEIEGGEQAEFLRVIVDGDATTSQKIELAPRKRTYSLASRLEPGEHQIQIIKETYTAQGRMTLHGLTVVDGDLVTYAGDQPSLRIEFYGDSNLAAVSLEHEKNQDSPSLRGCYYSFAGIASRMLDAEYQNISSSGATIAGGLNSGMSFYNRLDFFEAEPRWRFDRVPADLCVVNLGANDISSKSKMQIKKDYKSLVTALRTVHPKAHIVLMNGYGWSRKEPANYTQEVVAEMADAKLTRFDFPWLFNEWHGCEYDHAGMAQSLVNHVVTLNPDWKQRRPMDVMDGFGRGGDVANGSFESAAPFGGYGWRYFTDGAKRICDPATSADGEWFLRLPEGTQVHQPNPASKENRYRFKFKLRGAAIGDKARVIIEFRDQQWRHEIPGSSQEFVYDLGTKWTEHSLAVTAPAGARPPDPSRDPWQIIIRFEAQVGTVDIDDVRLASDEEKQNAVAQ